MQVGVDLHHAPLKGQERKAPDHFRYLAHCMASKEIFSQQAEPGAHQTEAGKARAERSYQCSFQVNIVLSNEGQKGLANVYTSAMHGLGEYAI